MWGMCGVDTLVRQPRKPRCSRLSKDEAAHQKRDISDILGKSEYEVFTKTPEEQPIQMRQTRVSGPHKATKVFHLRGVPGIY
jgi:hypothetical protein